MKPMLTFMPSRSRLIVASTADSTVSVEQAGMAPTQWPHHAASLLAGRIAQCYSLTGEEFFKTLRFDLDSEGVLDNLVGGHGIPIPANRVYPWIGEAIEPPTDIGTVLHWGGAPGELFLADELA